MSMFSRKLQDGQGVIGTFCRLGGAAVAECLSLSGLDYVVIDTEHGPFTEENMGEMIRAVQLHEAEPFVRVRDSSRAAVLHALDLGAKGIIVPNVQSVQEAASLVEFAKFHPTGARGFAFSRSASFGFAPGLDNIQGYFNKTNEETLLLPQCETGGALEHIEEIVAVDGIDGIFVGPYDLSAALGMPAQFDAPAFRDALERVLNACRKHGKFAFLYADSMAEARRSFEQGYQGAAVGVDTAFLVAGIRRMLAE